MNVKYRRESDAPGLLQGRAETNSPGVSGSLPYLTLYFNWIYHKKRIQFKRIRLFTNIVIHCIPSMHCVTTKITFLSSIHRVAFGANYVGKSCSHDVGTWRWGVCAWCAPRWRGPLLLSPRPPLSTVNPGSQKGKVLVGNCRGLLNSAYEYLHCFYISIG